MSLSGTQSVEGVAAPRFVGAFLAGRSMAEIGRVFVGKHLAPAVARYPIALAVSRDHVDVHEVEIAGPSRRQRYVFFAIEVAAGEAVPVVVVLTSHRSADGRVHSLGCV